MRNTTIWLALIFAALMAALAAIPVLTRAPALRAQSAPGQFDARRAKARLAYILADERPHSADTAADDAVRTRLVTLLAGMGLKPIIRDQFACNTIYKARGVSCARVRNVIAVLGLPTGRALLLNAHYDSVPVGPGASDDGAGVATLLEVASILKDQTLHRPVVLLFNEGEELGLVGARAFLSDPISRNVDSLINLEARGVTGPAIMFETSVPNGPAVTAFQRAVGRPYANSLATDFYRLLPNYTDVNSFSERGWLTLNLAMIGNESRYHSPGDDLAALDPASLQHMGDQTLALTRELASAEPGGGGTKLFADIAGHGLVAMPQWCGFLVLGLLVIAFAFVTAKRRAWRGLVAVLVGLIAASLLAMLLLWLIGSIRAGMFWRGHPVWAHLTMFGCGITLAAAAVAMCRRATVRQLRAGFWLAFLLIGVAVALIAPGGMIYFLLPPLVALIGMTAGRWLPWGERLGGVVAALLLWLTLGEVVALLTALLSNGPLLVFAPLALLIATPWLIEAKPLLGRISPGGAIAPAAILTVAAAVVTAAVPAYSANRQQRFTIRYVADPSARHAWWVTDDDGAPPPPAYGRGWSRRELPIGPAKLWVRNAPELPKPQAAVIQVTGRNSQIGRRSVTVRLNAPGSDQVFLIAPKDSRILAAGTAAFLRPIFPSATKAKYVVSCSGRSCDGAELTIVTATALPIPLTIVAVRYQLPPAAAPLLAARPRFARPQYIPDETMIVSHANI